LSPKQKLSILWVNQKAMVLGLSAVANKKQLMVINGNTKIKL
jgi:hypothetical protein